MAQKANSEYKPAIYARLSKEDKREDLSLSILIHHIEVTDKKNESGERGPVEITIYYNFIGEQ